MNKLALALRMITALAAVPSFGEATPHFFRISRNGVNSTIIGTVHVGISLHELPQKTQILSAMKAAKQLLVEWAFSKTQVEDFLNKPVYAFLQNPDSAGIPGTVPNLPPSSVEQLISYGVPETLATHMSENHCKILLFADFLFPKPASLDFEILQFAYQEKIPVVSLDSRDLIETTPATHCSISQWFYKYSKEYLKEVGKTLRNDYFKGDPTNDSKDMVIKRNRAWASQLNSQLNVPSFIAVGVGHLYGDQGLLQILRQQGFEITSL